MCPDRSVADLSEKVDILMSAMLGEGGASRDAITRTRKTPTGVLQVHERRDASGIVEDT